MEKRVVGHISTTYLKTSESYIYTFIKNHQKYSPFVITEEWINKDKFPLERVYEIPKASPGEKVINAFYKQQAFRKKGLEPYYLNYLRKEKPSVILCHYGPTGVYSLPFRDILKVPLVTFFYGMDLNFDRLEEVMRGASGFKLPILTKKDYWKKALATLFKRGDMFVVATNQLAQQLMELGAPQSKVRVVNFGVEKSDHKESFVHTGSANIKMLSVLSLEEGRGLDCLLDSFSMLIKEFPNISLDIYGEGSKKQELLSRIKDLRLDAFVKIVSGPYSTDIYKKFVDYDLFINPVELYNFGSMEGWVNYSMMQAASLGVVPISTHITGAELIESEVTGYFINPKDAVDLTDKLKFAIASKEHLKELSANVKERVRLYFDAKKQTSKLELVFDEAISNFKI